MSKLFSYVDYDIQVAEDSNKNKKMQIVGVREDGLKDILKEFDKEIDFVGFSPQREVAYAAPKTEKPHTGLKMGGAFILGLIIGGLLVYVAIRNRQEKVQAEIHAAPTPPMIMHDPLPVMPETTEPAEKQWIRDFDNDIFIRGN